MMPVMVGVAPGADQTGDIMPYHVGGEAELRPPGPPPKLKKTMSIVRSDDTVTALPTPRESRAPAEDVAEPAPGRNWNGWFRPGAFMPMAFGNYVPFAKPVQNPVDSKKRDEELLKKELLKKHKEMAERHLKAPSGPAARALRVLGHFIFLGILCVCLIWTRYTTPRGVYDVPEGVTHLEFIIRPTNNVDLKEDGLFLPSDTCTFRLTHPCRDGACVRRTFNGYGVETTKVEGGKMVVIVAPLQVLPFMPENWYNRIWCDLTISIPTNMTVSTQAPRIVMVAEDMHIDALSMTGTKGFEAQEITLYGRNLRVQRKLTAKARDFRLLMENLSMPDSARMDLWTSEGSVDITTESLPAVTIASANDAVCLVGEWNTTSGAALAVSELLETTNYSVSAIADPLSAKVAGRPTWSIKTVGKMGSVSILLLDLTNPKPTPYHSAPTYNQDESWERGKPNVAYSGKAFGNEGFFASVDHTKVDGEDAPNDYAIISLRGAGIMRGGLQLMWTKNPIFWFWNCETQYFASLSLFQVYPKATNYVATISFCPAHLSKRDLMPPLGKLMQKNDPQGFWVFRNLGSIRDSMTKNLVSSPWYPWDVNIPPCDYCGPVASWRSSFWVGSFGWTSTRDCEATGACISNYTPTKHHCAGLTDRQCYDCSKSGSKFFAFTALGENTCFPSEAVETLMSNNSVTFGSTTKQCLTSADVKCIGEPRAVYWRADAGLVFVLSFLVGFCVAVIFIRIIFFLVYVPRTKKSIADIIVREKRFLKYVQDAMVLSRKFAITSNPENNETHSSDEEEQLLHVETIMDFFRLDQLEPKVPFYRRWYRMFHQPSVERPHMIDLKVGHLASHRFVRKCRWISNVETQIKERDDQTTWCEIKNIEQLSRLSGVPLPLKRTWHIIYFPHYSPDSSDHGPPDDAKGDKTVSIDATDHREHEFTLPGQTQKVVYEEGEFARMEFRRLQTMLLTIKYTCQQLQIKYCIWSLVEDTCEVIAPEKLRLAEVEEKNKRPYFALGRRSFLNTVHTWKGELATVVKHVLVCYLGPVIVWSWFLIFFYARFADRGVTDFGWGGYGMYFFDYAGLPALNIMIIANWISCSIYNLNRTDWGYISDSERKLYARIAVLFGIHGKSSKVEHAQDEKAALGLSWEDIGTKEPTGANGSKEIKNEKLAKALKEGRNEFSSDEFNEFNIDGSNLSENCYIKAGDKFFKPRQVDDNEFYCVYKVNDVFYRVCMFERNVFHGLFLFTVWLIVGYYSQIAIWCLLGMFLDPNRIAPYAVAVTSLVLNITSMYKEKMTFFQETKSALKTEIVKFHQNLRDESVKMLQVHVAGARVTGTSTEFIEAQEGMHNLKDLQGPVSMRVKDDLQIDQEEAKKEAEVRVKEEQEAAAADKQETEAKTKADEDAAAAVKKHAEAKDRAVAHAESEMQKFKELKEKATKSVEDVSDMLVLTWLERYGISFQDIVVTIIMSTLLLILVFLFLFMGMNAFTTADSSVQAAINSFITAGSALASNRVSGGETVSYAKRRLRRLLVTIMDQYRVDHLSGAFVFGLDESLSAMMNRAKTKGVIN